MAPSSLFCFRPHLHKSLATPSLLCYSDTVKTKYLLTLAALFSLSLLPVMAQDEDVPADTEEETTTPNPEGIKAQKKAAAAARKMEAQAKARAKLKFKWHKNLKSALSAAKKYNTTCIVLYTDPATCPPCRKLDEEIFESKEFAKAKGIGVGFRSSSAIPEYNLGSGKPMGYVVGPDGRKLQFFGYSGTPVNDFIKMLQKLQPKMDIPKPETEEDKAEE